MSVRKNQICFVDYEVVDVFQVERLCIAVSGWARGGTRSIPLSGDELALEKELQQRFPVDRLIASYVAQRNELTTLSLLVRKD